MTEFFHSIPSFEEKATCPLPPYLLLSQLMRFMYTFYAAWSYSRWQPCRWRS